MSSRSANDRAARQARRTKLRSSDAPRAAPSSEDDVIDLTGEPSSPINEAHIRQLSQAQASQHNHDDQDRATQTPSARLNEHGHQAHLLKPRNAASPDWTDVDMADDDEVIDEDDICPICQLLLYEPVRTALCGHALCGFCMATWASVSLNAPSSANVPIVDIDDVDVDVDGSSGGTAQQTPETRCPMCRTLTSTNPDPSRKTALQEKYPRAYAAREAEVRAEELVSARDQAAASAGAQAITIAVGNRHVLVPPSPGELEENQHEWTFFVRPSRVDVIEEVHVHLHPTFRPSRVVLRPRTWRQRRGVTEGGPQQEQEEFQVTRLGWGVFEVTADVVLKAGYEWVGGGDAVRDTIDGARNGVLGLEWMLDFDRFTGRGSMKRVRCKVRREGAGGDGGRARRTRRAHGSGEVGNEDEDYEDQAGGEDEDEDPEMVRDMRETRRVIRQYERDGGYEPSARRRGR